MDTHDKENLRKLLIRHEGFMRKAYKDSRNIITIGVGRNLESRGLMDDEINLLLSNDINYYLNFLSTTYPFFESLNSARKIALCDMAFNLGTHGFSGFKKMLCFIINGEYEKASDEIMHSLYATQVGKRAIEISNIIKTGEL